MMKQYQVKFVWLLQPDYNTRVYAHNKDHAYKIALLNAEADGWRYEDPSETKIEELK